MLEILFSFVILLLLVAMMAVGVLKGRPPLAGTCGGLNNIGFDGACEICGGDTNKCEEVSNGDKTVRPGAAQYIDAS
ncbi:MAG: (Na+)-NQR maturation NqrM [Pseudomonadales bacterium]|nr:(Na+)-NQR maturation NqrM [Pseudomonadales bacterium]